MGTNEILLSTQGLSIYQKNALVLSDVNISVKRGEFVYVIGKTGVGKSSLLRTFYADIPVREGAVQVAGFDLCALKKKEIPFLRRKLGIVFQDFQLLTDRTVYENLEFMLRAVDCKDSLKIKQKINEVLAKVDMETKAHKMPHQLSGGEQQRLVIARALLNDPEIILADEPTGNLDPFASEDIFRLLREISKSGRSVLLATHDFDTIRKFPSRVLVCEDGRVTDKQL